MKEIKDGLGLINEIDVSCYADCKYTALQMNLIKSGLINKVDVSYYLNPNLTPK